MPWSRQQLRLEREDAQHVVGRCASPFRRARRATPRSTGRRSAPSSCRAPSARASRSRLKSGASTPMKTSGRSRAAAARAACGCRRSRGSGAAPRHSRAPRACPAATRRRSRCAAIRGPPMPDGLQLGPARLQAVEQQARQQVAGGLAGDHREARDSQSVRPTVERQRTMPRCAIRGEEASISATSPPPRASAVRQLRRSAAAPRSSVRPVAVQQPVHLLDGGDALAPRSRAGAGLRC